MFPFFTVVYGITTGFGKFARTVIDFDKLEYVSYSWEYLLCNNLSIIQKCIVKGDVLMLKFLP
jgi:hypothetical protein